MEHVPHLSVVVPVLNEESWLEALLRDVAALRVEHETIVVDGGSIDRTLEVAHAGADRWLLSRRGRAAQLAAGVGVARGRWLLLLHADSRFDRAARSAVEDFLADPTSEQAAGAYFQFGLDGQARTDRWIERGQRLRERLTGLVYGDQGLLVRKEILLAAGGIPDQPLMEDIELVRRLRSHGALVRLPAVLRTSARRYRNRGTLRTAARNAVLLGGYHLGVSPSRLLRWYPPHRPEGTRYDRVLLVFAKAPTPGRVKTRLARRLGEAEATRIYKRLATRVLEGLRGLEARVVVCYAPLEEGTAVARWLGPDGKAYWPQAPGDLGDRLRAATAEAFRWSSRVCVIGTDAPDLGRERVEEAFARLDEADVVLGPALDGGYYLLGLNRPTPEIFQEIPWSTDRVADVTRSRARQQGLTVAELEPLRDVDEVEDIPPYLRVRAPGSPL